MDLVSAAAACVLFFTPPFACPAPPNKSAFADTAVASWQSYIGEAARRFAIPEDWIARVMAAESGGRLTLNGNPITSPKGAMGLMQLMPETWLVMRQRLKLGDDPYDPHDNILAGAAYLRMLWEEFGTEGMFAAYNAGPTRYRAYLAGTKPLPVETEAYLARIASGPSPHMRHEPSRIINTDTGGLFVPLSSSPR
ncbi:soluble lytic murein transglycosylase-like protein [Rhizomicrobium palustre]|uniref:Soluble lytic murein transglycosylase-like protein n=1 Tax=Rhizomicrobium palustre TaxID=189966 RepID=A0A846MWG7_9PROT|nr:lytic transglycosylase domain-containing protein [Rhizomicrobium palustre]NIK87565.1 soluble lytic murein transglycosylase-like protein [Rhizomicrobium palustre]